MMARPARDGGSSPGSAAADGPLLAGMMVTVWPGASSLGSDPGAGAAGAGAGALATGAGAAAAAAVEIGAVSGASRRDMRFTAGGRARRGRPAERSGSLRGSSMAEATAAGPAGNCCRVRSRRGT
jgi:hypothetical protein